MARRNSRGEVVPASEAGKKSYRVKCSREWTRTNYYTESGYEYGYVTVEAADEDEAEQIVNDTITEDEVEWNDDISWRNDDDYSNNGDPELSDGDFEVSEVEEVEEDE